jgi:competence protein ComEA
MRLQNPIARSILVAAMILACAQPGFPQHPQPAPSTQSSAEPLNINTATSQQLNALPGFGPAYTRCVIAGRPYTAKNQLVTRGVIPQGAYERVSDLIVAHRVAK